MRSRHIRSLHQCLAQSQIEHALVEIIIMFSDFFPCDAGCVTAGREMATRRSRRLIVRYRASSEEVYSERGIVGG